MLPHTELTRALHWLPIREFRITYKISVMTYKVRSLRKPAYLDGLITKYETTISLRSSYKEFLTETRTRTMIASRAFRVATPHTWNGLPVKVRTAPSIDTFYGRLNPSLWHRLGLPIRQMLAPLTRCLWSLQDIRTVTEIWHHTNLDWLIDCMSSIITKLRGWAMVSSHYDCGLNSAVKSIHRSTVSEADGLWR